MPAIAILQGPLAPSDSRMHVALVFSNGDNRNRYFDFRYGAFHLEPVEGARYHHSLIIPANDGQFDALSRDSSDLYMRADPLEDARYSKKPEKLQAFGTAASFNELLRGRRTNPLFRFTCVTLVGHLLSRVGLDHPLSAGMHSATETGDHLAALQATPAGTLLSNAHGMGYDEISAAMRQIARDRCPA